MSINTALCVGIDASNLRQGGGITHLSELLQVANPSDQGISRVVVWAGDKTLAHLPNQVWLEKVSVPQLNGPLWQRTLWQVFALSKNARKAGCDILFIPGGSFVGSFKPVVAMSQNLLPFEWRELWRSGFSVHTLKMLLLRGVQTFSFRRVQGLIFLSHYAQSAVERVTGSLSCPTQVISHGLAPSFQIDPVALTMPLAMSQFSQAEPFLILCVGNIDAYKHPGTVLKAVAALRKEGLPLRLEFVGPAVPKTLRHLQAQMLALDPIGAWVKYHGPLLLAELKAKYQAAQVGVFASSCETFGIILLEEMAMGLPLACANRSAMPEIAKDSVVYFDPESIPSLVHALDALIHSPELRLANRTAALQLAREYTWQTSAKETFTFLREVAQHHLPS